MRFLFVLILISSSYVLVALANENVKGYWIWAGISPNSVPATGDLYIYQGLITEKQSRAVFLRKGLYPHPIETKGLYLSFRISGELPDPVEFKKLVMAVTADWEKHEVLVKGIQLDFDSPTSKLSKYKNFLLNFRQVLPQKYKVSVTGLGDWLVDRDQNTLKEITKVTDEIIFQLYQGRRPLPNIDFYINKLIAIKYPFKAGFLGQHQNQKHIATLNMTPYFMGAVIFTQR
jgi:hypothetical protein